MEEYMQQRLQDPKYHIDEAKNNNETKDER